MKPEIVDMRFERLISYDESNINLPGLPSVNAATPVYFLIYVTDPEAVGQHTFNYTLETEFLQYPKYEYSIGLDVVPPEVCNHKFDYQGERKDLTYVTRNQRLAFPEENFEEFG